MRKVPHGKAITKKEVAIMQQMIEEGYKLEAIASKLDRNTSVVYKKLHQSGYRLVKKWVKTHE